MSVRENYIHILKFNIFLKKLNTYKILLNIYIYYYLYIYIKCSLTHIYIYLINAYIYIYLKLVSYILSFNTTTIVYISAFHQLLRVVDTISFSLLWEYQHISVR